MNMSVQSHGCLESHIHKCTCKYSHIGVWNLQIQNKHTKKPQNSAFRLSKGTILMLAQQTSQDTLEKKYVWAYVRVRVCVCVCVCMCVDESRHIGKEVYGHIGIEVYSLLYIYIYICIYLYSRRVKTHWKRSLRHLTLNATRTTSSCSHRRQNKTHWKKRLQPVTLTATQYNTLHHYHVRTAHKTKQTGKADHGFWLLGYKIDPTTTKHCNTL